LRPALTYLPAMPKAGRRVATRAIWKCMLDVVVVVVELIGVV
jgi:hypothetical protein